MRGCKFIVFLQKDEMVDCHKIFPLLLYGTVLTKQVQLCLQHSLPALSGAFIHNWKHLNSQEYHDKEVYLQKHLYEKKNLCLESRSAAAPGCKACWSLEYSKSTPKLSTGAAPLVLLSLLGIWCKQKLCFHRCESDKGYVTIRKELVQQQNTLKCHWEFLFYHSSSLFCQRSKPEKHGYWHVKNITGVSSGGGR